MGRPSKVNDPCLDCGKNPRVKQRSYCGGCLAIRSKGYEKTRTIKETHLTCVYYLPEEHYVGITDNLRSRKGTHKRNGNCVGNLEILAYFERRVDAHVFETLLHQRGYRGFNATN